MSNIANTRLFAGSILQVRNADDTDWIGNAEITSLSGFGLVSEEIPTVSAASDLGDESRPGTPSAGDGSVGLFFYPDDPFQARILELLASDEIVAFRVVLPEGTNTIAEFEGYPLDMPISAQGVNVAYTTTLSIACNSRFRFQAP